MNDSVFLCTTEDLVEGSYREFIVECADGPVEIVATRYHGAARAWHNICPHQGRPLNFAPDRFLVDPRGHVVCAHHGAVFEPDAGTCVAGPCLHAALKALELTESGGRIHVTCP